MRSRRYTKGLFVFLVACAAAAIGDRAPPGQTSSTPAVNVVRNAALYGTMWPADFNGDGKTDLVASDNPDSSNGGAIVVALGTGTGSFGAPIKSSFKGRVLAVGDMNGDGKVDVIATAYGAQSVFVLPGNGDGTFGGALPVDGDSDILFAVVADLDGDGKRDLIVGSDGANTPSVYPGKGDFTFGARALRCRWLAAPSRTTRSSPTSTATA